MTRRFPDMRLTRDQWSTGDAIAAGIAMIVGICVIVFVIALLAASGVRAHDWYPPLCCSGGDCGPIDDSRITRAPGEYIIDGRWHVPVRSATPSPDGRFHGCWPDKDKPPVCVFAPPDGV